MFLKIMVMVFSVEFTLAVSEARGRKNLIGQEVKDALSNKRVRHHKLLLFQSSYMVDQ